MKINKGKITAQLGNFTLLLSTMYFIWQFMRVGAERLSLATSVISLFIIIQIIVVGGSK